MYCQKCGADNLENAALCQQCGGVFVYSKPTRTSGMAITSAILGISGFSMFGVFGITWLIGLVFGIIALSRVGKSGGQLKGKGFAITGIATSAAGLALLLTVIGLLLFVHSATMISLSKKLKMHDDFTATAQMSQGPDIKGSVCVEDKSAPGRNCENVLFTLDESEAQFSAATMNMTCGSKGQEPVRLSWQFAGNEKQADVYNFTITFPVGENAVGASKKKIVYDGTEQVIFEDAQRKIYIRPEK
jgi:uncharacterized membrane protein YtjA (UPF0391 family)